MYVTFALPVGFALNGWITSSCHCSVFLHKLHHAK